MNLIQGFLEGLRPVPNLTVDQWADRYRFLSSVSSAEPGRWRTDRVPYMREIFQKLSPSDPTQFVTLMKGVQIAGTEAALNVVGCYIDIAPCPIMYVMPTVDTAKQLSKKRLHHMIVESPTLQEKVVDANKKEGASTILEKNFAGGVAFLTGANSAAGLRSNPVKVLILDETDAYPISLGDEGSPVRLAEKRTTTFSDKKIFKLSTPTKRGESVIATELDLTDERTYRVPCPDCGHFQELRFEQLKWEHRKPETAKYECEACTFLIEERHKTKMLNDGHWEATRPEMSSELAVGYRINSLYSPLGWMSWEEVSGQFLRDRKDPLLLQTFINTVLGEPWEDRGESPDWERLYERREDYAFNAPPNEVEMITVGCDVQGDRLELEVVGWCRDKTTYSIDYRVLHGDTSALSMPVWDRLSEVVNEVWYRPDGIELPVSMLAIDSGNNTQTVYNWCRRFEPSKVVPVKGREQQKTLISTPSKVDVTISGKPAGKLKLWNVGVGTAKSELYALLKLGFVTKSKEGEDVGKSEEVKRPAGYCHFPQYDENYFKGLTTETLVLKIHKGYRKYEWELGTFKRNEPIDCRVYARAAAAIIGIDRFNDQHWDALVGKYRVKGKGNQEPMRPTESKPKKKKKSSGFWDGY